MKATDHLTCAELVELVTEYLEASMPAGERVRFEEHLVYCPGCVYYLDQMRHTISLVGGLSEAAIPAPAAEKLLEVFRDWKSGG